MGYIHGYSDRTHRPKHRGKIQVATGTLHTAPEWEAFFAFILVKTRRRPVVTVLRHVCGTDSDRQLGKLDDQGMS